ncbi:eCIS core domain-containing protein [Hyalangium gracile]|uniref:eCIS core domain-containing protein n=1 Tax=Hyalangium gracile TaxID=394092 RepID=UPI001CD038EF|nr:DUF4157 domain-containing protein [Hyalangium gracile]
MSKSRGQAEPASASLHSPTEATASAELLADIRAQAEQVARFGHRFDGVQRTTADRPREPGQKLPPTVQARMEAAFGTSFSSVRIHQGREAETAGALAYTCGTDIHFAPGLYQPHSQHGQRLLGHELAHIVQQSQGRVRATGEVEGLPLNEDSSLEREADVLGGRAARGEPALMEGAPPAHVASAPAAQRAVIQRVGGLKIGFKKAEGLNQEGEQAVEVLQRLIDNYKAHLRARKQAAKRNYDDAVARLPRGATVPDRVRQDYVRVLREAELTEETLRRELPGYGFTFNGDELQYQTVPIATLLHGDALYELKDADDEEALVNPVYRKHTLRGPSDTEYIKTDQGYLRREVSRGILPREAYELDRGYKDIKPLIHDPRERLQEHRGYFYNESSHEHEPRRERNREGNHVETDLEWLNRRLGTQLDTIPEELLPFLQERKGATKLFSATSTTKQVTSNHGADFAKFGTVTIDLAKVPREHILHQYNDPRPDLEKWGLQDFQARSRLPYHRQNFHFEARVASETSLRNREVHLAQYPSSAVTDKRNLDRSYIEHRRRLREREERERARRERERERRELEKARDEERARRRVREKEAERERERQREASDQGQSSTERKRKHH